MALAGMGSSLWSVNGGNKLVPELLLKDSKAKVIPASVTSIRLKDDQFVVRYNSTAGHHLSSDVTEVENDVENNVQVEDIYDIVIVATPLIQDVTNIRFEGFPRPIHNFKGKYHRTVCTIVSGEINRSYFKLPPGLDCSLTTTTDTDYNSLSLLYPANCTTSKLTSNVWNLFSQVPLSEEKIGRMFNKVYEKHVTDWLAYPHYTPPENLGPFILHPGLYYVNSIEWAASAMEMSAIGGRNAALLAYKYWYGINGKHDSVSLI